MMTTTTPHDPAFAGNWADPGNLDDLDAQSFGLPVTQNPSHSAAQNSGNPVAQSAKKPARAPEWVQHSVRWVARYPTISLGIAVAIVIVGFAGHWARPQAPEQGQAQIPTETVDAPPSTYDPRAANKQAMTRTAIEEKTAFKALVARTAAEEQAHLADRIRAYLRFSLTLVGQESKAAQEQGRPARWADQATVLQGLLAQKAIELEEASRQQTGGQASADLTKGTIIQEIQAILGAIKAVENKDVAFESNPADPTQTSQPLLFAGDVHQYVRTRQTLQLATAEFQRAVGAEATQEAASFNATPANYVPQQPEVQP